MFRNQRLGALTVRVRDSVTQSLLAGVEFRIVYADGRPVDNANGQQSSNGIYTTDGNGEINITGITGTIVVTQTKSIDGYSVNAASAVQTVVVNPAETQTLTFINDPNQTLTIQKVASDSGNPLAGAAFLVTDGDGAVIGPNNGEYVTDQNGRIVIENLLPGTVVTVKEIRTVSGYVLDNAPQSIRIRQGEAQTLTFRNALKGSLTVRLIDGVTEQILVGAEFRVTTLSGVAVDANEGQTSTNGIYRTDDNGQFTISGLQPGSYTITQTRASEGYVKDENPQTVTVNADDAQTITFRNAPLRTLTVWNYAAGTTTPLVSTLFLVTDGDGKVLGSDNGIYRTDENGRFIVSGLTPGATVHVKQTAVIDGYVLNGNSQSIRIRNGEAQNLTFYNEPCGTLEILKRDALTGQPLKGAVFQIMTAGGQFVDNNGGQRSSNGLYTTDDSGQILIHGLNPATLVVREVAAPVGYVLDEASQTVEIHTNDTQTLTFRNVPTQTVVVRKFVQGTTEPLAGVRFLITDGSGRAFGSGEYITDENGQIVIDGIAPGTTVIALETRSVSGYTLNGAPQSLEVVSGRENVLTFYDEPLSTLVVHVYLDGTDNEPLANVGFQIVDGRGAVVGGNDGVHYTDRTGSITISNLQPGVTVNARMFKIADGFVLDGISQDVTMESGRVQELTFWAKRQGGLTVRVLDSLTRQPVPGVEIRLVYADGRPVDTANGQISSVGQYFTDDNGEIHVTGISGTVVVTEEKTVSGYSMDANNRVKTVIVNPAETQTATFFDTPAQALTVQLYVTDTTDPISGARFLVTDGSGTRLGEENGEFVTDENGRFALSGLTPGTTVNVQQLATVSGYLKAEDAKNIEIHSGDAQSLTFYNAPTQALTVQLYAKGTTTPISGARFLVTDGDGSRLGEQNGEFVTDENGQFALNGLTPGTTVNVHQIATVSGYLKAENAQSIEIRSGDAQNLTFYNPPTQTLTVRLFVKDTATPITGGKFLLRDSGGALIGTDNGKFTTDHKELCKNIVTKAGECGKVKKEEEQEGE